MVIHLVAIIMCFIMFYEFIEADKKYRSGEWKFCWDVKIKCKFGPIENSLFTNYKVHVDTQF